jgi:hypothetical protein
VSDHPSGRLSAEANKRLVRRRVDEAVAWRNLDVLDELAAGECAITFEPRPSGRIVELAPDGGEHEWGTIFDSYGRPGRSA